DQGPEALVSPPALTDIDLQVTVLQGTANRQWAILQQLFAGVEIDDRPSPLIRAVVRVVLMVAIAKAVCQGAAWLLLGYPIAPVGAVSLPTVHALMFVGFFLPGLFLLTAGRRDRRAIYLGGLFLVFATAFV